MAKKKTQAIKCLVLLGVSGFLLYQSALEVQTWFEYQESLSLVNKENEELVEKQQALTEEVNNLNDVEYIIRYARGKYLATKDVGDQVFMLPGEE